MSYVWRPFGGRAAASQSAETPSESALLSAGIDPEEVRRRRLTPWQRVKRGAGRAAAFTSRLEAQALEGRVPSIKRAWEGGPLLGDVYQRQLEEIEAEQPSDFAGKAFKAFLAPARAVHKRLGPVGRGIESSVISAAFDPLSYVGVGPVKHSVTAAKELLAASKVGRAAIRGGLEVTPEALENIVRAAARTRAMPTIKELSEAGIPFAEHESVLNVAREAIEQARQVPRTAIQFGIGKYQRQLGSPEGWRAAKETLFTGPARKAVEKFPALGYPSKVFSASYVRKRSLQESAIADITQAGEALRAGGVAARVGKERMIQGLSNALTTRHGLTESENVTALRYFYRLFGDPLEDAKYFDTLSEAAEGPLKRIYMETAEEARNISSLTSKTILEELPEAQRPIVVKLSKSVHDLMEDVYKRSETARQVEALSETVSKAQVALRGQRELEEGRKALAPQARGAIEAESARAARLGELAAESPALQFEAAQTGHIGKSGTWETGQGEELLHRLARGEPGETYRQVERIATDFMETKPKYTVGYLRGLSKYPSEFLSPEAVKRLKLGALGPSVDPTTLKKTWKNPVLRLYASDSARRMGKEVIEEAKSGARLVEGGIQDLNPQQAAQHMNDGLAMLKLSRMLEPETDMVKLAADRIFKEVSAGLRRTLFQHVKRFARPASEVSEDVENYVKAPWREMEGLYVPKELFDVVDDIASKPVGASLIGLAPKPEAHALMKAWSEFNNWFKPMVIAAGPQGIRWNVQNLFEAAWKLTLAGTKNPRLGEVITIMGLKGGQEELRALTVAMGLESRTAQKLLAKASGTMDFPRYGSVPVIEVADRFTQGGLTIGMPVGETGLRALQQARIGSPLWERIIRSRWNPLSPSFLPTRGAFLINENVDEAVKVSIALDQLYKGATFEEAIGFAQRLGFDYTRLTPIEQQVKFWGYPFMTWITRAIRREVENAIKQPGKVGAVLRTRESFEERARPLPEEWKPEWLESEMAFRTDETGPPVFTNVSQVVPPLQVLSTEAKDLLTSLHPLASVPLQMIQSRKAFSGQEAPPLEILKGSIPVLSTIMRYKKRSQIPSVTPAVRATDMQFVGGELTGIRSYTGYPSAMARISKGKQQQRINDELKRLREQGLLMPSEGQRSSRKRWQREAQREGWSEELPLE